MIIAIHCLYAVDTILLYDYMIRITTPENKISTFIQIEKPYHQIEILTGNLIHI